MQIRILDHKTVTNLPILTALQSYTLECRHVDKIFAVTDVLREIGLFQLKTTYVVDCDECMFGVC